MDSVVVKKKNGNTMPTIRTQKYAETAYPLVNAIKGKDLESKYRTLALNLPTMILQSGLMQTVGFLLAKGTEEHLTIYQHLKILLNDDNLHETVRTSDIVKYQRLTRNAIEASSWLKRYTQALLEKDKKQEQNNDPVNA